MIGKWRNPPLNVESCILGGVVMGYLRNVDPKYYDEKIYFVCFVTYLIVLPIMFLLIKKLPRRLTDNDKFQSFFLILMLIIIPVLVLTIYCVFFY